MVDCGIGVEGVRRFDDPNLNQQCVEVLRGEMNVKNCPTEPSTVYVQSSRTAQSFKMMTNKY